jgi:hypothetical protein
MKHTRTMIFAVSALLSAAPAMAASDMYIKFDGVDGEAKASVPVDGWSFGTCTAGACTTIVSPRDPASGQATGKRQKGVVRVQASQNTQSLRSAPTSASSGATEVSETVQEESKKPPKEMHWDLATGKGARTAGGGVAVATGDVDGDGHVDLAYVDTQSEVTSFSLLIGKPTPALAKLCTGKHFTSVTLTRGGESYVITDGMLSCSTSADALTDGLLILRFSSGQMKHVRTGHVTLLK